MIELPSLNFDDRPPDVPVDMLVLHYTGMESADAALARLTDAASRLSAHYVIDEDGAVFRLVGEGHRAWHAGEAWWRGSADVNARSIGVELVNPGHEFGYRPFPEVQMAALEELVRGVLARHPIPARNVVGHSDVAPRRKMDPGELFDWRRLARAGMGLWPHRPGRFDGAAGAGAESGTLAAMLAQFGYETVDPRSTIVAFQRHFRPARIDGRIDGETSAGLSALLALCAQGDA